MTLSAEADPGSQFTGWSGACTGTDACMVTMDEDRAVTAMFLHTDGSTGFTLTVKRTGTGSGTVTSLPEGINCPDDCSEIFPEDTEISLSQSAGQGSLFLGWDGGDDCLDGVVTMTEERVCVAKFEALANATAFLPQVANGPFEGGSIRTTFIFFNTNESKAEVTVRLTDNSGGPFQVTIPELGTGSEFKLTLDPGETRIFDTDGGGQLQSGAAVVTASAQIGVSSIFSILDLDGGFVTEAGVGRSPALTEFVFPVDSTGLFNTGVALFNPGAEDISLEFRLLDTSGLEQGRVDRVLGTKGHLAIFVAGELFPELSDFQGTVFVSSSAPVAALTLRQNASPLSFTTLPVISRAATRLNFNLPHVANGEFSGRSIRTSFIVFNISSATASINLSLSRDDGAPFSVTIPGMGTDSSFNLDLNPGAAAFFGTDGAGEVAAGAVVLDSDQPLGVAAIFTIVGEQGQFLTEAGVGDSVPLQEFVIPVDSTGQFDTGIALFNGRTVPVAVTFRLLNSNGNEDNSASLSLGENSHMAQFVSGLFPTASDFRGSLSVSASNPLAALTLRKNAQPLSFTTLPVAEGVGSPAVTGTWKGTYSLTVVLKSTCSNLNAVTHSGELTLTISQAGDGLTGTAELTGVKEIVESASSNCTVGDPVTVSGNFTGTLSGRSISGEISFGDAPAGQLTLGATAAAAGVEKIVLMGSLSNSNRSLIGELENERLDPEKRSGSGAFFLEKLQESLCDASAECDGILKQILNICGGYKERVIEFAGEANGYSFRSFLCTDDRANDDCDGILRPIAVPCPDPAFQDCTTPCGGGPVLSSSFALDHQCNQSTSEEVEEDQKLCNVICTACIPVKLTVKKIGSGSGMVTLNPAGESCGEDCTQYDGGKEVTLEAKPDDDSIFKDWGGDCEGTAPCNLKMTTNKEVTATFDKEDQTPPPFGTLYIGSTDNRFYAIRGSSGGLANSSWPMFRRDLKHTAIGGTGQ